MPAPFFCALSPPHPAASRAPDFHPAQKNRRCPPSDALCPPSPLPSNAGDARLGRLSSARFATADFLPAFSPGGLFFVRSPSDVAAFICAAAHARAESGTDAPRRMHISPFAPLFSLFERTSPFFRTAKIILSLPPSFVAAQKTAFAEQSPLSESAASKNTAAEPAAQPHIFRRTKAKRPAPHFRAAQGALKNSDEASADSCGRPRRKILRAPQHAAPASFFINT